jgi:AbrB family looped-hinge helix DNA binding protein
MTTTVSKNNEVSIPADIARELDIHPGTELEWEKTGEGTVIVRPLPSRAELERQLRGAGRRWLKPGDDPIAELVRERRHDDELDQADEEK